MNSINILGTITKDIELKYLNSGSGVANFSIAYNKKFKGADGQLHDKTSFFDVTAFGKSAETINQFFRKGSRILIRGELEQQQWKAQDGTGRSKVLIKLEQFDFIDRKDDNQGAGQYGSQYGESQNSPRPQQTEPPKPTYRQPTSTATPVPEVDESEIPF